MNGTLDLVRGWLTEMGYASLFPALFLDATGVPWPWVFLCALSEEAKLNVPMLLALGVMALSAWDHTCYWLGATAGTRLLNWLKTRVPALCNAAESATKTVTERPLFSVVLGRFIPVAGRLLGFGAGMAGMNYAKFIALDAIGVLITIVGFGLPAHLLGRQVVSDPRFASALNVVLAGAAVAFGLYLAYQLWRAIQRRNAKLGNASAEGV